MLKQTIRYTDFNGQPQTTVEYFNIHPREVRELGIPSMIKDATRINEKFQELIHDETRDQESIEFRSEVNEIVGQFLDIIEHLIDVSYGIRLDDNRFRKSPEALAEFKETAAFSDFLTSFVQEPDVAKNFVEGLVPQNLITGDSTPAVRQPIQPQDHLPSARERFTAIQEEKKAETEEEMRARLRAEILAESQVARPDGLN